MMWTVREWRREGMMPASRLVAFIGLLCHQERAQTFELAQERKRQRLAGVVSNALKVSRVGSRRDTGLQAERLRETYLQQCVDLRGCQVKEQDEMKEAWATRNIERQAAYAPLREKAAQWELARARPHLPLQLSQSRQLGRD